jgi:hypothetical protein
MKNSNNSSGNTLSKNSAPSKSPVRFIDKQDQILSSIDNLTDGLTPDERDKRLKEISESIPTATKSKQEKGYDWIEDAMNRNPKLTREKALEMARAFGFY